MELECMGGPFDGQTVTMEGCRWARPVISDVEGDLHQDMHRYDVDEGRDGLVLVYVGKVRMW